MSSSIRLESGNDTVAGWSSYIPAVILVIMALVMLLPVGTGFAPEKMPHLVMIGVFYWVSRRPLILPYGACALAGLLLDLWLNVPLGLNMMIMVILRLVVLNQLKFYRGRSRVLQWGMFVGLSLPLFGAMWLLGSLAQLTILPIIPVVIQWAFTAFAYAPVGFVLGRVRRLI